MHQSDNKIVKSVIIIQAALLTYLATEQNQYKCESVREAWDAIYKTLEGKHCHEEVDPMTKRRDEFKRLFPSIPKEQE